MADKGIGTSTAQTPTVASAPAAAPAPVAAAPAAAPERNIRASGRLAMTDLGAPKEPTAAPVVDTPAPAPAPVAEPEKAAEVATPAAVKDGEPAPLPVETPPAPIPGVPAPGTELALLKTKTGREFKTPDELLSAYENSSAEGLRLAMEAKTLKLAQEDMANKLQMANTALLDLQSVAGNGLYPGLKNSEEVEAMTEDERFNYYQDKRDWGKRQEELKARVETAKEDSEKFAKRVQEEIARNDQLMASDPQRYPEYKDLAPLRDQVLATSPHLANRPDSQYNAYFIALGMTKLKEMETARTMSDKARAEAAAKADAISRQAGTGATPPPAARVETAPKATGFEGLIKAGQQRKSVY